jgi:hypothetical protein
VNTRYKKIYKFYFKQKQNTLWNETVLALKLETIWSKNLMFAQRTKKGKGSNFKTYQNKEFQNIGKTFLEKFC